MTITIPIWLLWLVGIPLGIIIISLAVIGGMFLYSFRGGIY